jgi:hypothetical protein
MHVIGRRWCMVVSWRTRSFALLFKWTSYPDYNSDVLDR